MRVPPTGRGGGPPKNKKKKHQIWDIRTKNGIHVLTGHTNTVASVVAQAATPQVISGGMDSTIRLWDLAAGKTMSVLTNHKKSIRSLVLHPTEYARVCPS